MRNPWKLSLLLTLPVIIFFLAYFFNHAPHLIPTGFIQYDNVSYIAYAQQYLDADTFHLQYTNPFNDGPSYTPIYFQIQTWFFALLLYAGFPVFLILPLFTIICSFFCFHLLIRIYDLIVQNDRYRTLMLFLLSWGGGLLVAAGIAYHYSANTGHSLSSELFSLDPESGWWGLNFGRSLLFSCEAYYHFLFISTIYFVLKKRWWPALICMLLLVLSHPFTGIELSLIISLWCFVEKIFRKLELPFFFLAGSVFITGFHLFFYLVYLEQFPEHQSVKEQYSLTWGLRYYRMIPAYGLVVAFAIATLFREKWKPFFQKRHNRIFFCWFLVAFLLANHDVFISPMQPIHFTRGYIWTSLFLLGIPALHHFLLRNKKPVIFLLAIIFLADNALWLALHAKATADGPATAYITMEQKQLFEQLDKHSGNQTLIVSTDYQIAYLSSVYTKAYPLYSHPYTTPFARKKLEIQDRLLTEMKLDASLNGKEILLIVDASDSTASHAAKSLSFSPLFETRNYRVWKKQP